MSIVFGQVFILLSFSVIGYCLAKWDILKAEQSNILSGVLVYIFGTCNIFKAFATDFNVAYLKENYQIILISVVVLLAMSCINHFVSKLFSGDKYTRYVYAYSLTVPNYGYMGYGLAESILGASGLFSVMVYAIPLNIYIYLIAFCILAKRPFSFKGLLNVMTITMLIGMAFGLMEIELPHIALSALDKSRACMLPVSMILLGVVISKFKIKEILSNYKIYIVTALRLVVIPVAVGCVLRLFLPFSAVCPAVIALAMPCGANTIVFPDLVGEDCRIGAGLALVSTVLSCVTIPVVFSLFGIT